MDEEQGAPSDGGKGRGAGQGAGTGTGTGTGEDGPGRGSWPGTGRGTSADARTLTRSNDPKLVGGVCAGLGRYFDLDPVIFRVPLAVLSVTGGLGLVFYGFAWLFIPADGETENEAKRLLSGRVEGASLSAILIALVGCGLFLASLGTRNTSFSLVLVGAVIGAAYWSQHRRQAEAAEAAGAPVDPATAHAVADAPPETQAPPVPGAPPWWRYPLTKDGQGAYGKYGAYGGAGAGTGYLWGPDDETDAGGAGAGGWVRRLSGGGSRDSLAGLRRQRQRRRSGPLGGLFALLASVAAVLGTLSGWDSRPLGTSLVIGLACALAVHGVGLVVSAFAGRVGAGTVKHVVVTAALLAGATALPKDIGTDWRDTTWAPTSAATLRPAYRMDSGSGELDLRRLDLTRKHPSVRTEARVAAGQLKVLVPEDAAVELDARVGAGVIRVPKGTNADGQVVFDSLSGVHKHRHTTLRPLGGVKQHGTVRLRLDAEVGQVEVVRELASRAAPHAGGGSGSAR